jgi:replication factor A1
VYVNHCHLLLTLQIVSDIIGVCKSSGDVQTLMSRSTNRELKKREVVVVDQSNKSVSKWVK